MVNIEVETQNLLESHLNLQSGEASSVLSKMIEVEQVRLLVAVRFLLKNPEPLSSLFFLEALVASKKDAKAQKLKTLFRMHASQEEKIELVDNFCFSKHYQFGNQREEVRHVLYADFEQDTVWKNLNMPDPNSFVQYCSAGGRAPICFCRDWLNEHQSKIDRFLDEVVGKLYEMRCAVVHESFPVLFVSDYSKQEKKMGINSTLVDVYPVGKNLDEFCSYESSINGERFNEITRNVAKRYLLSA